MKKIILSISLPVGQTVEQWQAAVIAFCWRMEIQAELSSPEVLQCKFYLLIQINQFENYFRFKVMNLT